MKNVRRTVARIIQEEIADGAVFVGDDRTPEEKIAAAERSIAIIERRAGGHPNRAEIGLLRSLREGIAADREEIRRRDAN